MQSPREGKRQDGDGKGERSGGGFRSGTQLSEQARVFLEDVGRQPIIDEAQLGQELPACQDVEVAPKPRNVLQDQPVRCLVGG